MALDLETLSSNELLSNFIIYDTISAASPFNNVHASLPETSLLENVVLNYRHQEKQDDPAFEKSVVRTRKREATGEAERKQNAATAAQGRKKRRRKPRVCKNKEEAETQRITHITVERNRRKQMNEHLAVLRSLMPESYVQRGDQASIVGGAIEFVKELEHLLQSLEAKKVQILEEKEKKNKNEESGIWKAMIPFAQFFAYPQITWSQSNPNNNSSNKLYRASKNEDAAAIADIEVTLIETHANLRILTRKCHGQLFKLVAGFQALCLTILHLNVTTVDPLVFYSISAKVEEGFQLGSVDGIATAVHHLLGRIEEEASLCC